MSCMQRERSCSPFDSTPNNINGLVSAEVQRQFSVRQQGMVESVAKILLEIMSKRDEAVDKKLSDLMLDVHSSLEKNSVVLATDQMERTSSRLQICEQKIQDIESSKTGCNNMQKNTQFNVMVSSNETQLGQIDQRLNTFDEKTLEMGGLLQSLGEKIESLEATTKDMESACKAQTDIEKQITNSVLAKIELKFGDLADKHVVATTASKPEVLGRDKNGDFDNAQTTLRAAGQNLPADSLSHQDSLAAMSAGIDVEHSFEPTIWDALFLIAFPGQTAMDMIAHAFVTLVYFQLLVVFLYVIAYDFVDNPYSDFALSRFEFWRATSGHDVRHVDTFDKSSLTSRTCSDDPALTVATQQQNAYSDINAYLNMMPIGLGVRVGPVICVACLFIWTMSILLSEVGAVRKLIVIWSIRSPLSSQLLFSGEACELIRVQLGRVLMLTFTFFLRTAFNITLLIYGGWWLVDTSDIPDLLLNTTALGFLLDVDAMMFNLGAPHVLRFTIARMKPLKVRKFPGVHLWPTINVLVANCIVLIFFLSVVQPNVDRMQQAADILCGNDRDFVASIEVPFGVNWVKTEPYNPDVPTSTWKDGRIFALQSLMMQSGDLQLYTDLQSSVGAVSAFHHVTLSQHVISQGSCVDTDGSNNIGSKLFVISNNKSMKLLPRCENLRYLCFEFGAVGQAMRLMCPITCGCMRSFKAGLVFLGYSMEGCTTPASLHCSNIYQLNAVKEFQLKTDCNDTAKAELPTMSWNVIVDVVSRAGTYLGTPAIALNASRELALFGCAGLLNLNESIRSTLCLSHSIPFVCPSTCKCGFCATCIRVADCPNPCLNLPVGQLS